MLHFVTTYMNQNKSHKQTLESAQYRLEISFNIILSFSTCSQSFKKIGMREILGTNVLKAPLINIKCLVQLK